MADRIQLGDIAVDVVFKDIKHVHLSVYPPDGRVRLAAPTHMSLDTLRLFALSKLGWIRTQQQKLHAQERETPREVLERESHYLWGRRYLLRLVEEEAAPTVTINPGSLVLRVRPGTSQAQRDAVMAGWYRRQVRDAAHVLIGNWESILGVRVQRLFVQRMKTRWGSCNPETRTIRLNTELAKKPVECLEYILVHELTHLLERHHNARFVELMDRHLPQWRLSRDLLNGLPLAHVEWGY